MGGEKSNTIYSNLQHLSVVIGAFNLIFFKKKHLWWSHRSNHKLLSKLMKLSVGLSTFVGGLKTKKSLRPGWLSTNQGLKTKKSLRPG